MITYTDGASHLLPRTIPGMSRACWPTTSASAHSPPSMSRKTTMVTAVPAVSSCRNSTA
jgi:hypothetical protein